MKRLTRLFLLAWLVVLALGMAIASAQDEPEIPEPIPPYSPAAPDALYEIESERIIGHYAVRLWKNMNEETSLGFDSVVTIAWQGDRYADRVQVDEVFELDPLSGRDINGDGEPEVIVTSYSGGAHCCYSTEIYTLTETAPERILNTFSSECRIRLDDLDDDGIQEIVTCDDTFAYDYCPFASSPLVAVILSYDPDRGYIADSPAYPEAYAESIDDHTVLAQNAAPGELGEWDNTNKCGVLPLVLDLLYSGQMDRAWSELQRLYRGDDLEDFQRSIWQTINASVLYRTPEPPVAEPRLLIDEQLVISPYIIRLWRPDNVSAFSFEGITTIEDEAGMLAQIPLSAEINPLSGIDITGEGNPDVIVETYSGGARCCFSTIVYDLGESLREVLRTPESTCGGSFEDVNNDGVYEYLTCDDAFANSYCPYAFSHAPTVVMAYDGDRFTPVTPDYPQLFEDRINSAQETAALVEPGDFGEWDETTKCAVLPVVLDLLYSGQTERAWAEFERLYRFGDADDFRTEIEATIAASDLYISP